MLPKRKIVLTAEPTTSGEVYRILRNGLKEASGVEQASPAKRMNELFLFMADHAQHLDRIVQPSLKDAAVVLSDRYADSTAAYQGVTLEGIVPDPVVWIQEIFRPWNVVPDITLLFLLDPELALKRLGSRPGKEKFERPDFLRSVEKNFRKISSAEPERFVLIDAAQDEEAVARDAARAVLKLLAR
jgi:dTMP kinase